MERERDQARPGHESVEAPNGGARLPRPSARLAALTSSALALPGIAQADSPIDQAQASIAQSYYKEDDISRNKFGGGDRERYEVQTTQLRFDIPATKRIDLGVQFLYEEMSGASPWFVSANPQGDIVQVLSGATIEDERYDLTLDLDYYLETGKDSFAWGFSKEKDYFSTHFSIGGDRNYNDKNTTLSLSGAFSYDWIETTDPEFSLARIAKGEKFSIDAFMGLSQILTRSTTGQVTINYKYSDGYLSDPYKAIQDVTGSSGLLPDVRPDTKHQVSILGRVRQHIEPLNASVHLDYRFFADTFKITSHTVELAWYQNLFNWLTIAPTLRYYSQSKAEFYETVLPLNVVPKERSSDFRLSPYGAVSARIKAEAEIRDIASAFDLILAFSYERYLSDGDYALTAVSEADEAPGLVKFQVFAGTITGRF